LKTRNIQWVPEFALLGAAKANTLKLLQVIVPAVQQDDGLPQTKLPPLTETIAAPIDLQNPLAIEIAKQLRHLTAAEGKESFLRKTMKDTFDPIFLVRNFQPQINAQDLFILLCAMFALS